MAINKKHIFIILPFFCFILGYLLSNLLIGNKTYTTPKLIGLSLYDAMKLTSPHQINMRILSEKESANIPVGTILSQKPSPGRIIKSHQPIFVTITKSSPNIIAPSFMQQPYEAIEKSCQKMNLKCKSYQLEYCAPANSCIAQLPGANSTIHDKKIIVYCAKNKSDTFLVPDFTNQPLAEVIDCLKNHTDKIAIFHGSQKLTSPYPQQVKIVGQKPLAGSLVSMHPSLNIQLEVH